MPRTTFYTATSLDGFIATEDHSLDWLLTRQGGEAGPLGYEAFIAGIGALCMGANTYEWVYRYGHDADGAVTEPWAYEQPCWVFTHRELPTWPGADLRFTSAPVPEVYAEMTSVAGERGIWVVGGGDLAGQFLDHGLLDELIVSIAPVTLGSGKPLLPRHAELRLAELLHSGEFASARYEVVRAD